MTMNVARWKCAWPSRHVSAAACRDHHQRVNLCAEDRYPFDHSAPDLSTEIRCLHVGLHVRQESVPQDDIEMDKLWRNQGAQIFGDKLKCNNS